MDFTRETLHRRRHQRFAIVPIKPPHRLPASPFSFCTLLPEISYSPLCVIKNSAFRKAIRRRGFGAAARFQPSRLFSLSSRRPSFHRIINRVYVYFFLLTPSNTGRSFFFICYFGPRHFTTFVRRSIFQAQSLHANEALISRDAFSNFDLMLLVKTEM